MSRLGQSAQATTTAEKLADIASVLNPLSVATSAAYTAHIQSEINQARIKAGLPPIDAVTTEEVASGNISKLLALLATASLVYWFIIRKKNVGS